MNFDTIVALATPPGEGAIGIVRLSGKNAYDIFQKIFRPSRGVIEKRSMQYGHIVDNSNEKVIDEVMAVYFNAPRTYTAEDVVEIHCHGGNVSIYSIIRLALKNGARAAEAGEFTKRAFLNGRLDLTQAEAVMDVVGAKTENSLDLALGQLDGRLSKKIGKFRDSLIDLLGNLEVSIDYPEEDIEEVTYDMIVNTVAQLIESMDKILDTASSGKIIREGINIVITGRPNVGKSSLLNRLLRENRAIVTDIPGTTRDVIEEYLNIKGVAVKIVDTAGIRDTEDIVEKIGVDRTRQTVQNADLIILVLNGAEGITKEDMEIISTISHMNVIVLINKVDIECRISEEDIKELIDHEICLFTSMKLEDGIDELESGIFSLVSEGSFKGVNSAEDIVVSNARHIDLLNKSKKSLEDALDGANRGVPYDFIQVDLKDTYDNLGEITGQTARESLLDNIFARFCLGK